MTWIVLPNMMPCGRVILPALGRLEAESSKDGNCRGLLIREVFRRNVRSSMEARCLQGGTEVVSRIKFE